MSSMKKTSEKEKEAKINKQIIVDCKRVWQVIIKCLTFSCTRLPFNRLHIVI